MKLYIKSPKELTDTLLESIWRQAFITQIIVETPENNILYWSIYNKIKAYKSYIRERSINPILSHEWARLKKCNMLRRNYNIIIRYRFPRGKDSKFTLPEQLKFLETN